MGYGESILIGLAFSGGIDSTCLAYELMLQHDDLCFITADWKDTKIYAKRVIDILEKITGKSVEHILIPDTNNNTYMIQYGKVIQEKRLSSLYFGTTKYPDHMDIKRIKSYGMIKMPYEHMTKDQVLRRMQHYKIMHLIDYTNSCELNDITKDECMECDQCKEKQWAFEKIGYVQ
jgi:7-cyano-7-deazaguanine synthase in queuosine biosynthesis